MIIEDWQLHHPATDRAPGAPGTIGLSDEFMQRVADDRTWCLFDTGRAADLAELDGAAFAERYGEYVALAGAGRVAHRRVGARDHLADLVGLLRAGRVTALVWKDAVAGRDLGGGVPGSEPGRRGVLNVAQFLAAPGVGVEWVRLAGAVRRAVRRLDEGVDLAPVTDPDRRLALGVAGFGDLVEALGLGYGSSAARVLADRLLEFISWHAIDASADLARERGSFASVHSSGWSRGLVPIDTLDMLEGRRGLVAARLDWDRLRLKVAGGLRNAALLSISPDAPGLVPAGTSPGLQPAGGQVASVDAVLQVVARAQKWVDQTISHTLTADCSTATWVAACLRGWRLGLKTAPGPVRVMDDWAVAEQVGTQAAGARVAAGVGAGRVVTGPWQRATA
ncbi:hypothetical protein [Aestuariimicrobium sp. Y1814]|uniref:hypothetical protein n=1 Tax=Aestuariimicrobium sp. Y1814 TaxID=3418742 RepID=UPI003DA7A355